AHRHSPQHLPRPSGERRRAARHARGRGGIGLSLHRARRDRGGRGHLSALHRAARHEPSRPLHGGAGEPLELRLSARTRPFEAVDAGDARPCEEPAHGVSRRFPERRAFGTRGCVDGSLAPPSNVEFSGDAFALHRCAGRDAANAIRSGAAGSGAWVTTRRRKAAQPRRVEWDDPRLNEARTGGRTSMAKDYDIIIVGGGIGGSALAATIAKAGRHVLVLEKSTVFE